MSAMQIAIWQVIVTDLQKEQQLREMRRQLNRRRRTYPFTRQDAIDEISNRYPDHCG